MTGYTGQDKIRNESIREKIDIVPIVKKMGKSRLYRMFDLIPAPSNGKKFWLLLIAYSALILFSNCALQSFKNCLYKSCA